MGEFGRFLEALSLWIGCLHITKMSRRGREGVIQILRHQALGEKGGRRRAGGVGRVEVKIWTCGGREDFKDKGGRVEDERTCVGCEEGGGGA